MRGVKQVLTDGFLKRLFRGVAYWRTLGAMVKNTSDPYAWVLPWRPDHQDGHADHAQADGVSRFVLDSMCRFDKSDTLIVGEIMLDNKIFFAIT